MENKIDIKHILNTYGMVLILGALYAGLSLKIDGFYSLETFLSILEQVSMFGIISIGVTMAIITTGIDLSSGSVVALASVVAAIIVKGSDGAFLALCAFVAAVGIGGIEP